ncbi:sensor histidine kinase [Catenulispora subtropica]|uniref:histidine kinase n=1 Tax=Catenulispora subtropica TaxID=450798 RepID=A0ABN2SUX4_9ACTN
MADTAALPAPMPGRGRRSPLASRLRPWQRIAVDGFVALLFLVPFGSPRPHGPVTANPWLSLLVVTISVAFLARRRFPVTVFLLLTAGTLALAASPAPYNSYQPFAIMFALYTVAATRSGKVTTLAAGGILAVALVVLTAMHTSPSTTVLSAAAVAFAPAVTGYAVRQQRLHHEALAAEQAGKIEAEVTSRLAEERLRIARELHDVVAHALSLITVQAGVAVFREHEASRMRTTLASIEETGRTAMVDMRQLLGVLRGTPAPDSSGPTDLGPVPDLLDIGTLISQTAQAGLRITLREEGERRPLPTAVGLAVYRIVQESLTNVLRHARTTTGSVLLRFEPDAVTVTVANPPPPDGLPPAPPGPPGHGLRGMAERTALFGGTFTAGPAGDGGFTVAARFPA